MTEETETPEQINKRMADLTLGLLQRVEIRGAEVPAYIAAQQWLLMWADPEPMPELPEQPGDEPVPHEEPS